jgi:vacuolar-type H+-ATPase subunit I/STV1
MGGTHIYMSKTTKAETLEPESATIKGKVVKAIVAIILAGGLILLANQLSSYTNKIRVQKIEIETKTTRVKQLETNFKKVDSDLTKALEDKTVTDAQLQEIEANRVKLEQELQETKKQLQAKLDAKNAKPNTAYADSVPEPVVSGSLNSWMAAAGVPINERAAASYIIHKESGANYQAQNPTSSAYGLCQTMMSIHKPGGDFRTNPVTQMKWCQDYAVRRYGNWNNAKAFWVANRHW